MIKSFIKIMSDDEIAPVVCFVFFGLGFLTCFGFYSLGGSYNSIALDTIKQCEMDLPRTQNCKIIAVPKEGK